MAKPLRFHSRSFFELVAPHVYGGASRRSQLQTSDEAGLWLRRPPGLRGYPYLALGDLCPPLSHMSNPAGLPTAA